MAEWYTCTTSNGLQVRCKSTIIPCSYISVGHVNCWFGSLTAVLFPQSTSCTSCSQLGNGDLLWHWLGITGLLQVQQVVVHPYTYMGSYSELAHGIATGILWTPFTWHILGHFANNHIYLYIRKKTWNGTFMNNQGNPCENDYIYVVTNIINMISMQRQCSQ